MADAIGQKKICASTRGEPLVLGIDLDNTIVDYDALVWEVASQRGLVGSDHAQGKQAVRDSIQRLPEGDLHWRRVQAVVYGDRMQDARLMPGVGEVLLTCKRQGIPVHIISHKTEFSNLGESDTNFHAAALAWLESFGFFDPNGFGLERGNVSFHDTREEKIQYIVTSGVTHFVDDLEELFHELAFPRDVVRIHFTPQRSSSNSPEIHSFASWDEIATYLFGDDITTGHRCAMADDTLHRVLSSLLKKPVVAATQIGQGRNSQVFRVQCANSDSYAAKVYFGQRADGLSRLSVEFESLELLWSHGIRCIPKPLAADTDGGIAVYEYVEGEEIDGPGVGQDEIDELLTFLGKLRDLARTVSDLRLPAAYEACFSIAAIVENINEKLGRLTALGDGSPACAALHAFLQGQFVPVLRAHVARAKTLLGEERYSAELPMELRTLSPADFGFHNALRRRVTGLVFLDFEYFGWEEPVKMISDFLLHPAVSLAQDVREYFAVRFLECFGDDEQLPARLRAAYPLFGLRWCMILLNEFLPDHLERRTFASSREHDVPSLLAQQLQKSKEMLLKTAREHECFPCAL